MVTLSSLSHLPLDLLLMPALVLFAPLLDRLPVVLQRFTRMPVFFLKRLAVHHIFCQALFGIGHLLFQRMAGDGREGLDRAQALRPDLILIDIAMSEIEGQEATSRLREREAFKEVPIIVVSANVSGADSEKCLTAGANAFLSKPVDLDKLLRQLAKWLRLEWTDAMPATAPAPQLERATSMVVPPAQEMEVL